MATLTIQLTANQLEELKRLAAEYNIAAEALAEISVQQLLDHPQQHLNKVSDYVLRKNADLYRKLA